MAVLKHPEAKKLVLEILMFTDEVEEIMNHPMAGGQGTGKFKPCTRRVLPAQHQRGRNTLRQLIIDNMEVLVADKDQTERIKKSEQKEDVKPVMASELKWMTVKDYKPEEGSTIIQEKHSDAELELSEQQIKALKFFKDDREVYHNEYSNEALDALDELLKPSVPANA